MQYAKRSKRKICNLQIFRFAFIYTRYNVDAEGCIYLYAIPCGRGGGVLKKIVFGQTPLMNDPLSFELGVLI